MDSQMKKVPPRSPLQLGKLPKCKNQEKESGGQSAKALSLLPPIPQISREKGKMKAHHRHILEKKVMGLPTPNLFPNHNGWGK